MFIIGTVTLWSPNMKESLVKILCHKASVKSMAINQTGNYMVTSGLDNLLNVWDLRTYKLLRSTRLKSGASSLAFSQKNMVAASYRNEVCIFKNEILEPYGNGDEFMDENSDEQIVELFDEKKFYLRHQLKNTSIQTLQFCPFEDVLGIGHGTGISSILVPGN